MTYRPTPHGLERNAREVAHVLRVALHRMDALGYPRTGDNLKSNGLTATGEVAGDNMLLRLGRNNLHTYHTAQNVSGQPQER